MNIAIDGEGDAPAKRCGATLKINGDIASVLDNEYDLEDALSTYLLGLEATDTDFESQAVSGTPIKIEDNYYIPIAIGITKALYDYLNEYGEGHEDWIYDAELAIEGKDLVTPIFINSIALYIDANNNCALVGLVGVGSEGTTTLCEDNWEALEIFDDEYSVGKYNFFNDKSFAPTDLTFTPAEQSEGD